MGSAISAAFIPPDSLLGCEEIDEVVTCLGPELSHDWVFGFIQVLFLGASYGYVLFFASNMLSEGSELLLLVPSLAGVVGSVVLPILGAVPDGAIMLFSGLGPDAQEQMSVGVGALAGSTIMLLTVPWGLAIFAGSVPVGAAGHALYGKKAIAAEKQKIALRRAKTSSLSTSKGLWGYGVTPEATIKENAGIMVATSLCYLIIQGPAFQYAKSGSEVNDATAKEEHWWSLAGLLVTLCGFVYYLIKMVQQSGGEHRQKVVDKVMVKQLEAKGNALTLTGIMGPIIAGAKAGVHSQQGLGKFKESLLGEEEAKRLARLIAPFFAKYDTNGDGKLNASELRMLLADLGEPITAEEEAAWMLKLDPNQSGHIDSEDELLDSLMAFVKAKVEEAAVAVPEVPEELEEPADGDEDEDEAEMPEDLVSLSYEEQQALIKKRAATMMGVGTALILVFSDPMVDVMSNMGSRLSIPPFYIAFALAPLASNASELLASFAYASKKTKKTITVSLAALEGAACMNNTFCLAIFMGLIYFKQLAWKFSAETVTILLIELCVAALAVQETQRQLHAVVLLLMFPASIALVAGLEAVGFD